MTTLTRLPDGTKIAMFFYDHNPPHFHAIGPGWLVRIDIRNLNVLTASPNVPLAAMRAIIDFARRRQPELALCWARCVTGMKPGKLQP
jgi:hypothetical protein